MRLVCKKNYSENFIKKTGGFFFFKDVIVSEKIELSITPNKEYEVTFYSKNFTEIINKFVVEIFTDEKEWKRVEFQNREKAMIFLKDVFEDPK